MRLIKKKVKKKWIRNLNNGKVTHIMYNQNIFLIYNKEKYKLLCCWSLVE